MRVSREEKTRSHARIVEAAARLARERGVEGASVADVMSEARLTHGGFYRHFDSKDAMLAAAIAAAFEQFTSALESALEKEAPEVALASYRDLYLSEGHVGHPALGCPVPALGAEVARGSAILKDAFAKGVERSIAAIARGRTDPPAERRAAAAREFAMLVGAIVIARATDAPIAREVLSACRGQARD